MRIRNLVALSTFVSALTASTSTAQACPTATLENYLSGSIGPCTIDAVTFSAFNGIFSATATAGGAFSTAGASEILVTPTSGLQGAFNYSGFSFSRTGGGDLQFLNGSAFPQTAISSLFFGATAVLGGSAVWSQISLASGSVAISPSTPSVALSNLTAQDADGMGVGISVDQLFPPFSATCTVDNCTTTYDGGAFTFWSNILMAGNATASLGEFEGRVLYSAETTSVVPEPSSAILLASGMLLIGAAVARRKA